MSKYIKSSSAKYMKQLRAAYPAGARVSTRNPGVFSDTRFNKYEFKLVLPLVLKNMISGKGSSLKPGNL